MVACGTLTVRLHLYSLAEVIHTGVGLFGDAAVSLGGCGAVDCSTSKEGQLARASSS